MPVIIPPGFGVVSFHTQTVDDPEEMVWTCGVDLTEWSADPDFPAVAADAWEDRWAEYTSSIVTLVAVNLKMGPVTTGPTYSWSGAKPGTDAGSLLPPNCCILIQKRTLLGGRMNRGRAYIPGISEISATLDSGGNFDAGVASALAGAMQLMWDDLGSNGTYGSAAPVLLHSASSDPTPITDFVCPPKIATQRRRLRP